MALQLEVDVVVFATSVLLAVAVLIAALASRATSRLKVPGALLFLAIGMIVGDDGLGWINLADTDLVRDLGIVALLLILFEGGLTTKPTDLKRAAGPGIALATLGVVITAAITGFGAWLIFDVEPLVAALLGSVVASTDAAAVFSMMRTTPLPRRVSALLRIESGANDPVAMMLTIGILAMIEGQSLGVGDWAWFALLQLGGGVIIGGLTGFAGSWMLRRVVLGVEGFYPVLALAIAGAGYGLAAIVGASGFVAVYVIGLYIGWLVPRRRRSVLGFHEAAANAAEVGLFLVLGLLVFPSQLPSIALPALAVAGVLMFVARPAAVWMSTLGAGTGWRTRTVISWGGLRGAVPIVLATIPFTDGVDSGGLIFNVVFFVVLVSVLVQGTTLLPVVRGLGIEEQTAAWAPVAEALPLDGIDIDLVELNVTEDLTIAGKKLRELPPLDHALVSAVVRGSKVLIPTGKTRIQVGDVLLLTSQVEDDVVARITAWARGEDPGRHDRGDTSYGR